MKMAWPSLFGASGLVGRLVAHQIARPVLSLSPGRQLSVTVAETPSPVPKSSASKYIKKDSARRVLRESVRTQLKVDTAKFQHMRKYKQKDYTPTFDYSFMKPLKVVRPRVSEVDKFGRSLGVGGRKTCSAYCYVKKGSGNVFVNGIPMADYFPDLPLRANIMDAFFVAGAAGQFDAWAVAQGSGKSGV